MMKARDGRPENGDGRQKAGDLVSAGSERVVIKSLKILSDTVKDHVGKLG